MPLFMQGYGWAVCRIDKRLKDRFKAALVIVINSSALVMQPMREGGALRQIWHGRQGCGIFEGGFFGNVRESRVFKVGAGARDSRSCL